METRSASPSVAAHRVSEPWTVRAMREPDPRPMHEWAQGRYGERVCVHGVGHPDRAVSLLPGAGVHGCCGCCVGQYGTAETAEQVTDE